MFAPEGYSGTPRQPTPRLLVLIGEFDQAGTRDSRWVHSRPVQRVVATVG